MLWLVLPWHPPLPIPIRQCRRIQAPCPTRRPFLVPVSATAASGIRVVAAIIDAIIVRVVVIPFGAIFGGMSVLPGLAGGTPNLGMALFGAGITLVFVLVGGWLYEAFMESSSYQATLGKMIFGMKVTDRNGNRISFARATGRHFAVTLKLAPANWRRRPLTTR
jgi:uncharacterized RDD family membrane protein YckC